MTKIPTATLKRLPHYLEVLKQLRRAGLKDVSISKISVFADVHQSLVRKDLAYTGIEYKAKLGFDVKALSASIEACLNWNDTSACYLVGVGHLGSALLGYQEFAQKGLSIVGAFDNDVRLIGNTVHGVPVHSILDFSTMALEKRIEIGIITVPPEAAQLVADIMVHSGIKAIWNFTPHKISTPSHIIVEYVDMFASLAVLSRRLAETN